MNQSGLFDVSDKCIIITGASSGLGRHFAEVLAAAGAKVALAARRTDRLTELMDAIISRGGQAIAVEMDVTDESSITTALKFIEANLSAPDVLVNNAGIAINKTYLETTTHDWHKMVDTNLIGVANVARLVAHSMKDHGNGGSIINIASILGIRPGNLAAAYGASKAAVVHLTKGMALEMARYNIRVNAILPGFIPTELTDLDDTALARLARQIPQKRVGLPSDLNGALLLLSSTASTYMTGSTITVDGGHSSNSL